MPYFKNDNGVYFTDAEEAILGGIPATDQEIEHHLATKDVPTSVSRFQARTALFEAGHFPAIESIMNNPATPMRTRLAWQDAQEFERLSPTVLQLGGALGLGDAELDQLFLAAAQIKA